jgi:hypothetical protein
MALNETRCPDPPRTPEEQDKAHSDPCGQNQAHRRVSHVPVEPPRASTTASTAARMVGVEDVSLDADDGASGVLTYSDSKFPAKPAKIPTITAAMAR